MSTVAIETDNEDEDQYCGHGISYAEECMYCDPESALEAQQQAEECSDMNTFHRY